MYISTFFFVVETRGIEGLRSNSNVRQTKPKRREKKPSRSPVKWHVSDVVRYKKRKTATPLFSASLLHDKKSQASRSPVHLFLSSFSPLTLNHSLDNVKGLEVERKECRKRGQGLKKAFVLSFFCFALLFIYFYCYYLMGSR